MTDGEGPILSEEDRTNMALRRAQDLEAECLRLRAWMERKEADAYESHSDVAQDLEETEAELSRVRADRGRISREVHQLRTEVDRLRGRTEVLERQRDEVLSWAEANADGPYAQTVSREVEEMTRRFALELGEREVEL